LQLSSGCGVSAVAAQAAATCLPLDRRLPRFRLRSRQLRRLAGQRFVLRCDGWERGAALPAAHLVRALGRLNDARCARSRRCGRGRRLSGTLALVHTRACALRIVLQENGRAALLC